MKRDQPPYAVGQIVTDVRTRCGRRAIARALTTASDSKDEARAAAFESADNIRRSLGVTWFELIKNDGAGDG